MSFSCSALGRKMDNQPSNRAGTRRDPLLRPCTRHEPVRKYTFPQPLIVADGCLHELLECTVHPSGRRGQERQHQPPLANSIRGLRAASEERSCSRISSNPACSSAASTSPTVPGAACASPAARWREPLPGPLGHRFTAQQSLQGLPSPSPLEHSIDTSEVGELVLCVTEGLMVLHLVEVRIGNRHLHSLLPDP